jgi:hypothetical protein
MRMVLNEGDKYLTVSLLNGSIKVAAFKNKDRKGNEPHYKGDGVAIWVNEKKADPQKAEVKQTVGEDVL